MSVSGVGTGGVVFGPRERANQAPPPSMRPGRPSHPARAVPSARSATAWGRSGGAWSLGAIRRSAWKELTGSARCPGRKTPGGVARSWVLHGGRPGGEPKAPVLAGQDHGATPPLFGAARYATHATSEYTPISEVRIETARKRGLSDVPGVYLARVWGPKRAGRGGSGASCARVSGTSGTFRTVSTDEVPRTPNL